MTVLRNWCIALEKEAVKFLVSVKGRKFLVLYLDGFCYKGLGR
jgi:hypothetical protein